MEWWFVVKTYENGQWDKFKFYADETTARSIGRLNNPRATAPPDKMVIFAHRDGEWVEVEKKGV